jgi:carbonic anhydrase
MIEITWQFDPDNPAVERHPVTAAEVVALLGEGNAAFASIDPTRPEASHYVMSVTAEDLGFGGAPGEAPQQTPFAALLGCADARVPPELVLSQSANDVFVVRVAGNVLGAECVGSLDYAISHLPSLRLLAVIGHTGCGAVAAAVDAYLRPATYLGVSHNLPLRAVVDAIMAAVRGADAALRARHGDDVARRPGYRLALIDTAVLLNAAVAADALSRMFSDRLSDSLDVAFGVYDLASRLIGTPSLQTGAWRAGLIPPPNGDEFLAFIETVVGSPHIRGLLDTPSARPSSPTRPEWPLPGRK